MFGQILGDFNTKPNKELVFNQNLHIEYYLLFYCISDDHSKTAAVAFLPLGLEHYQLGDGFGGKRGGELCFG